MRDHATRDRAFRPALATLAIAAAAALVSAQGAPPKPAPHPSPAAPAASTKPSVPKPAAKPTPAPAPVLEGVVRGPDRKPVEKALVIATLPPERMLTTRELAPLVTRTDAEGRFRLSPKTRDARTVRVEATGLAARTLKDVVPGTPLAIDLVRGARIEGVVRDGDTGDPVAGARVDARERGSVAVPGEVDSGRVVARTDASGRFALEGLGSGSQSLTARSPSGGFATKSNARPGTRVELLVFPAATVTGTVTGPDNRPVPGAVVKTYGSGSAVEATDAQGRFALNGVPAGTHSIIATAPGLAPAVATNVVLERRSEAQVDLRLGAGSRIVGRLLDVRDRPVAGHVGIAELDGEPAPQSLALVSEAGADGRFSIERVPSGDHALGVMVPGHAFQRVEFSARATDRQVDVGDVKVEVGLTIRGRVRDASGQGIADATVMAHPARRMTNGGRARTEADGSFVVAGLEQTPYNVTVSAPGYARANETAEPGPDPVDIVLTRGAVLTGIVVDDRSRPVEEFRVAARPVQPRGFSAFANEEFSSPDGRFRIEGVGEGPLAVTVSAVDHVPTSLPGVRVAAGAEVDLGTIKLGAGARVRGSVVDEGGAFVAGAVVVVRGQGRDWMSFGNESEATTDFSGAFELTGVPPGSARATASHPNYASAEPVVLEVDPAKGASDVRLVLSQGGRVAGSVRRRDGAPVSGMEVRVYVPVGRTGLAAALVHADGTFAVEHVPAGLGTVNVAQVTSRGSLQVGASRSVDVREGETTNVDIVLRDILLSGRATRNGTPAPGLRLEAMGGGRYGGSFGMPAPAGSIQRMVATTREDGSFEMLLDEPGRVILTAVTADGRTRLPARPIEVPDADAHTVELSWSGAVVTGSVVDKDTDAPVPFADLFAAPAARGGEVGAAASAGPDGRFQIEVDPGGYRISARSRDDGYGTAEAAVTVGASGLADLKIALPKGLTISGRVTDVAGRPVGGISLAATSNADGDGPPSGGTSSLGDGTFTIGRLKAGSFAITATSDTGQFGLLPSVTAGTKNTSIVLRPGGTIDVTVVDADGQPVEDAWPIVTSVDGAPVRSMGRPARATDAQGTTSMTAPSGQLTVQVRKSGRVDGSTQVTLAPGERTAIRVALRSSEQSE